MVEYLHLPLSPPPLSFMVEHQVLGPLPLYLWLRNDVRYISTSLTYVLVLQPSFSILKTLSHWCPPFVVFLLLLFLSALFPILLSSLKWFLRKT